MSMHMHILYMMQHRLRMPMLGASESRWHGHDVRLWVVNGGVVVASKAADRCTHKTPDGDGRAHVCMCVCGKAPLTGGERAETQTVVYSSCDSLINGLILLVKTCPILCAVVKRDRLRGPGLRGASHRKRDARTVDSQCPDGPGRGKRLRHTTKAARNARVQ